jgi:hypothetical protein
MGDVSAAGQGNGRRRQREDVYLDTLREAMSEIRRRRRSLTPAGATDIVIDRFLRRGLHVPRHLAEQAARGALDPFWHFKHPVRAYREGWRWTLS